MKLLTLSIDVDTLAEDLYNTKLTSKEKNTLIDVTFEKILPRVLKFLDDNKIKATFFIIGKYAQNYRNSILEIYRGGHEIGNHTFNHLKQFSKLETKNILIELTKCHRVIAEITNSPPLGFRAPGYTINSIILDCLKELGYLYDTSLVPSWSYQFLKKIYRLLISKDKKNYFVPQELTCAFAPSVPYKLNPRCPFKPSEDSFFYEVPITVASFVQIPFLNAIRIRISSKLYKIFEPAFFKRSFVNTILHAIEFVTFEDFGQISPGLIVQHFIKIPLELRIARMSEMISYAKFHNFHITSIEKALKKYEANL